MHDEGLRSWSSAQLRASGLTRADIGRALRNGRLVRARRDVYLRPDAPAAVLTAARVGGRIDSTTLMRQLGVFVLDRSFGVVRIQAPSHGSRLRIPTAAAERVVVRWRDDDVPDHSVFAAVVPALAQAALDQPPRAAIATLDSALNTGTIDPVQLPDVFARLPARVQGLMRLVDGRAESGPETLMRLIARSFGASVEPQVVIDGVGRADLVVDGRIVVECDSREFHGGWEQQERDRLRDLGFAARGYAAMRPTARQIFDAPDLVREALGGLLRGRNA